ncbi:MAG: hypothetical protein GQ565_07230 [Candidatus Aegiribacteria sp.]|nr:hypothetical protein [Candidatus Aegiribacteria sp.]
MAQINITTFSQESNTFPALFPVEIDTNFSEVLREGFALLEKNPEILKMIERDLDIHGIEKKEKRHADRVWRDNHTRSLGLGLEMEEVVKCKERFPTPINYSVFLMDQPHFRAPVMLSLT